MRELPKTSHNMLSTWLHHDFFCALIMFSEPSGTLFWKWLWCSLMQQWVCNTKLLIVLCLLKKMWLTKENVELSSSGIVKLMWQVWFTEEHKLLLQNSSDWTWVFLRQAAQKQLFFILPEQCRLCQNFFFLSFFSFSVMGKSRILPRSSHLSLPPQCQQQWLASLLSVWLSTKRCVTKGSQITETTAVREQRQEAAAR